MPRLANRCGRQSRAGGGVDQRVHRVTTCMYSDRAARPSCVAWVTAPSDDTKTTDSGACNRLGDAETTTRVPRFSAAGSARIPSAIAVSVIDYTARVTTLRI